METIRSYRDIKTREVIELNIEDTRNCYLKGNDTFDNKINYLGIWTDNIGLKVVEIRSQNMIGFDICQNKSVYTSVDIKKFMERNNNVQVISREFFRKELDRIIELLKENNNANTTN